jgi:spore germination protein
LEPFKSHISRDDNSNREEMNEEEKIFIVLDSIKSDHHIKAGKQKKPTFTIKLKIDARLHEITEKLKLSEPKIMKLVEKETSKYIKKNIMKNIKMLQEAKVDPIGFGMEYKTVRNHGSLTQEEWDNLYKDATFDVKVELNLIRTGVTD